MQIFTTSQVAQALHVSPAAVSSWIDDGILVAYRLPGGGRRVTRGSLIAFLRQFSMPLELCPAEDPVEDEEAAAP